VTRTSTQFGRVFNPVQWIVTGERICQYCRFSPASVKIISHAWKRN